MAWIRAVGVALVVLLAGSRAASADKVGDLTRDLASDPDPKVRLVSATSLAKLSDPRSLSACIRTLGQDSDHVVRGAAAVCLRKLMIATTSSGDVRRVLRALLAAKGDPHRFVRKQAAKAYSYIQKLTPPPPPCVPPMNRLAPNPCSAVPSQVAAAAAAATATPTTP